MNLNTFRIDQIYQYLLIALAFLLPLTVVGGNLMMVSIVLLWLFSGDYKNKLNKIRSNKVLVASIIFFFLHVAGLLWTEDIKWGLHIVKKMIDFFIFLPILLTVTKKEYIKYYVSAFLLAMTISEITSYLIWFEVIDPFKTASVLNPTPFMSHISYNPFLAFAIYLLLHEVFFNTSINSMARFIYSFFAITMSINMFITGGRAGQVVFFVMIILLFFQYYQKKLLALIVSTVVVVGIFFSAYQSSEIFQQRVDQAINEASDPNLWKGVNTSIGERFVFAMNSWEIFKENPLIGIGTGDFPNEYKKVKALNTPNSLDTVNPHNMYILVLTQLGVLGLISLLSIFYFQVQFAKENKSIFLKNTGIALPILFLVIMLSDSYLLGHFTTFLFVFFSSFLYKDFASK